MSRRVVTVMRFRVFKNIVKQGFQGMWRNRGMGLASISSISAVVLILGVIIILIVSLNNVVLEVRTKFDEIQVYLHTDLERSEIDQVEKSIKSIEGVLSTTFLSREQGLEIMRENFEEESYLLEGLEEDNPLQDSYIIQLTDIEF